MDQQKTSKILNHGTLPKIAPETPPAWEETFECPSCGTTFSSTIKDLVCYRFDWDIRAEIDATEIVVFCPLPKCKYSIQLAIFPDGEVKSFSPIFPKELATHVRLIDNPGTQIVSMKYMTKNDNLV